MNPFAEIKTHTRCPNCNTEMYSTRQKMYDATALHCHKCDKRYIRYWRTGTIVEK